jgi:uncharacterized protein (DUF2236 family)
MINKRRIWFAINPIRLIRWLSGSKLAEELPISDTEPDPGLMGPGSMTWRLHREQWLILGGATCFLLQAAHPKVAQGAIDHSAYAEDPFGRVQRTVMAMTVLLTGTNREVNAVARRINQIHQSVHGTLTHSIGQYRAGEPYSAMDTSPLLWVHICFVEGMLAAYQNFVGPLAEVECEQYWQESCRYARRLGLTEATLPSSYRAMEAYRDRAIATEEVIVGEEARRIARTILYPPLPWPRQLIWGVVRVIAGGQLPPAIRAGYGLKWTWRQRSVFWCISRGCRLLRFLLPGVLGRSVLVNFAEQREQPRTSGAPAMAQVDS